MSVNLFKNQLIFLTSNFFSKKKKKKDKSKSVVSGEELEEDENFVPTNNKKIKVGDRVKRKGDEDEGIVKFLGLTKFAKGTWVGIELEKPSNKKFSFSFFFFLF